MAKTERPLSVLKAVALLPTNRPCRLLGEVLRSARIWHYLRSHWLANSVFTSLADIMDACETAWNRFAINNGLVSSLRAVAWAPNLPAL